MYGANNRAYPSMDAAAPASRGRSLLKRAGCFLLAVVLAFALIPLGAFVEKAYAAASWLDVGADVPYGGYTTNEFWVDGVIAYCGEPSKATPSSSSYTKSPLYVQGGHEYGNTPRDLARILYYGWGGPGFDPSMWPARDYAGNPMSQDLYIALTHIMVADYFSYEAQYALSGTSQQFQDWCWNEVMMWKPEGYAQRWHGVECNIVDRDNADPMPSSFVDECFCLATSSGSQVICGHNPGGLIKLHKTSSNTDITNGNPNYTLRSARYDVFRDRACTQKLLQSYTDANGNATYYVSPGAYYIKEAASPTGYAKDETVYTIYVPNGGSSALDTSDVPQSCTPYALLEKYDSELGCSDSGNLAQGSAALADARFSVDYYAGYYSSVKEAVASGNPIRNWVIRTDETGIARLEDAYKVAGDAFYLDSAGSPTMPLGTYVIRETEPPMGYLDVEPEAILCHVRANGDAVQAQYEAPLVGNQVIRGSVCIEKRDAESGLFTPLGSASLDGATFEVVNDSEHAVIVDGLSREPGEVCARLSIADNKAQLPERALPYGRYLIQEVAAGEGYRLTDGLPRTFCITYENETVSFTDDLAFFNYVNRSDIQLVKAHDVDMQRLAGIPFRITSETTGESHVMVTDENGMLNTSASHIPHSQNTNANDIPEGGDYDNCSSSAGIWFGLTQEGTLVPPDDALGALPYDTYTIEELRCSANTGYTLLKLEHIAVRQDNVAVDLGTMLDTKPNISTYASDASDGDKLVSAEPDAQVIDRVQYANLFPDKEYTLHAALIDSANGQPVTDRDGNAITASRSFIPEDVNGIIDIAIPADLAGAGERQLVVFEELICDGEVVAEHKDANSSSQTFWVKAPKLMTCASDAADGDKRVISSSRCEIIDNVSYFNLVPGSEYTLEGKLMVRDSNASSDGDEDHEGDSLLDADGAEAEQTLTFVPDAPSGSIEVRFSFNGLDLPSSFDIVVFEVLLKDGVTIASHEDMNDTAQTVEFRHPAIETDATDMHDGDKEVAGDVRSVVADSVSLSDLVPNKSYVLYGAMVDRDSAYAESPDWNIVIRAFEGEGDDPDSFAYGEDVAALPWIAIAKADVVSSSGAVTVEMEYALDQQNAGHDALFSGQAVILNILLEDEHIVAQHCNPEDDRQTVSVIAPAVTTEAVDFTDGDHNIMPSIDMVILDTVHYTGLVSGQEYEIHGTLMDKAARTKLVIDDKTIEETLAFTPNNSEGNITVALPVDTSKLPIGTEIVVFEQIFKDGEPIADDKDFGNENETVQVNRNLRSTAYAKTGIPYQIVPIAMGLLLAGGLPLAYVASQRIRARKSIGAKKID